MTTVAELEAAGMAVRLDGSDAIVTLPDDGSGVVMEVRVAVVDGEMAFQPTRSALQKRVLSLLQ